MVFYYRNRNWVQNRTILVQTTHARKQEDVCRLPDLVCPGLTSVLSSVSLLRSPRGRSGCGAGFQCTRCSISDPASSSRVPGLFSHSMWWVTDWIRHLLGHSHWWVLFQVECSNPNQQSMRVSACQWRLNGNTLEPSTVLSFAFTFFSSPPAPTPLPLYPPLSCFVFSPYPPP